MNAVEVRDVDKRRRGVEVLIGVQLEVVAGDAYGLTGPNGAGKSLLLRLIAGLERPDRGRIVVLGHDTMGAAPAARKAVGFVAERAFALRGLSVVEQLELVAECRGLRRQERRAAVDAMLELVDLGSLRDRLVTHLSRGQSRRLALATAMVHDPAVLICDEPLEGLDARGKVEMQEVLGELRAMGKTIVSAGNSVEDISRLCDSVGWLENGTLVRRPVLELLSLPSPLAADPDEEYQREQAA